MSRKLGIVKTGQSADGFNISLPANHVERTDMIYFDLDSKSIYLEDIVFGGGVSEVTSKKFIVAQAPVYLSSVQMNNTTPLEGTFRNNESAFHISSYGNMFMYFVDVIKTDGSIFAKELRTTDWLNLTNQIASKPGASTYNDIVYVQFYLKQLQNESNPVKLTAFNNLYSNLLGRGNLKRQWKDLSGSWGNNNYSISALANSCITQLLSQAFGLTFGSPTLPQYQNQLALLKVPTKQHTLDRMPNEQQVASGAIAVPIVGDFNGYTMFYNKTDGIIQDLMTISPTYQTTLHGIAAQYVKSYLCKYDLYNSTVTVNTWTPLQSNEMFGISCCKAVLCQFIYNGKTYQFIRIFPVTNDTFLLRNVPRDKINNPQLGVYRWGNKNKPVLVIRNNPGWDAGQYFGRMSLKDISEYMMSPKSASSRRTHWNNRRFRFCIVGSNGYMTNFTVPMQISNRIKGVPFRIEYDLSQFSSN